MSDTRDEGVALLRKLIAGAFFPYMGTGKILPRITDDEYLVLQELALRAGSDPPLTPPQDELVKLAKEIRSSYGFLMMRLGVMRDADDGYAVLRREWDNHEAAFRRLGELTGQEPVRVPTEAEHLNESRSPDVDGQASAVINGAARNSGGDVTPLSSPTCAEGGSQPLRGAGLEPADSLHPSAGGASPVRPSTEKP